MKVKYSAKHFKRNYETLPPEVQRRFMFVDALVCEGDLSRLKKQGWVYFVNLDADHAAFGSLKEDGRVFYWRFIGAKSGVPIIL